MHYLLRQTHDVQPGEVFLFHAAAGGVGLIACQWAKALGARLIGSVGSDEKAALAKQAGAWATINYHKEDIAQRVAELTHGEKVGVVYDSVGQSTWQASLNSLKRRGLMVSFGNASGPVTGVDLALLNQKGSLYVTRPSLNGYITNRAELQYASNELFSLIGSGAIRVEVKDEQKFALADAQRAHQVLESRSTSGSSLLILIAAKKGLLTEPFLLLRFVGVEQSPPETGVASATRILVVSHGDEIGRITASTNILTAPSGKNTLYVPHRAVKLPSCDRCRISGAASCASFIATD